MDGVLFVLATKHHEEAIPVVLIHPPVEEWVRESRAHGHNVEDGVDELVLLQPQRQVQVTSQLEHVEDRKSTRLNSSHL